MEKRFCCSWSTAAPSETAQSCHHAHPVRVPCWHERAAHAARGPHVQLPRAARDSRLRQRAAHRFPPKPSSSQVADASRRSCSALPRAVAHDCSAPMCGCGWVHRWVGVSTSDLAEHAVLCHGARFHVAMRLVTRRSEPFRTQELSRSARTSREASETFGDPHGAAVASVTTSRASSTVMQMRLPQAQALAAEPPGDASSTGRGKSGPARPERRRQAPAPARGISSLRSSAGRFSSRAGAATEASVRRAATARLRGHPMLC